MPRCPRGTRRNRINGLCEGCPAGTVRVRSGRCEPVAPVASDPQPYPCMTLPHQSRCPPRYQRDPNPPHNCHSCNGDENAILNHVSGMCHPFVQVPPTASGACPTGTRRRRGTCIRVIGDINAPPLPHIPASHIALSRGILANAGYLRAPGDDPVSYPRPTYMNAVQMAGLEQLIQTYTGIVLDNIVLMYVLSRASNRTASNVGPILEYANTINQRNQWSDFVFHYGDTNVIDLFKPEMDILNRFFPNVPAPHRPKAYKLYATCIEYILKATHSIANVNQADAKVRDIIPRLPKYLLDELMHTPADERDISIQKIHEDLRDNGAFYTNIGKVYLIPVAFFKPSVVPLKQTRVVYPATMMDVDSYMYADIPFDPARADHLCMVIKDGTTHAFSVPLELLRKAINPRTPPWLYMKCKGSSHSLSITDVQVYSNRLYLNIAKMGVPNTAYVDINELKTAIDSGHGVIILQPKEVSGTKLITQISSAYLYNVPQNVVSSSHCEVGQMGGFYEVYVTRRGRFL